MPSRQGVAFLLISFPLLLCMALWITLGRSALGRQQWALETVVHFLAKLPPLQFKTLKSLDLQAFLAFQAARQAIASKCYLSASFYTQFTWKTLWIIFGSSIAGHGCARLQRVGQFLRRAGDPLSFVLCSLTTGSALRVLWLEWRFPTGRGFPYVRLAQRLA